MAKTRKGQPGPAPETLKIDMPWQDAVKKAPRKKPAGGWPKALTGTKK